MSVCKLSDEHISALVNHANRITLDNTITYHFNGKDHSLVKHRDKLGYILAMENVISFNYYYRESNKVPPETLTYVYAGSTPRSNVQIIKLCDSYIYNASNCPDWKKTVAYAIVNAIKQNAIDSLPGYELADWTI